MIIKRNLRAQSRMIDGRLMLGIKGRAFEMDGVAADIWNLIDGKRSVDEIAESLAQEYDASPTELLQDTQAFVEQLLAAGLAEQS